LIAALLAGTWRWEPAAFDLLDTTRVDVRFEFPYLA
jgi:hypothetical protein